MVPDAYVSAEGVALPEGEIRMHEMCAVILSMRAFSHLYSIADLMATVFWHSTHTFTMFHWREISATKL